MSSFSFSIFSLSFFLLFVTLTSRFFLLSLSLSLSSLSHTALSLSLSFISLSHRSLSLSPRHYLEEQYTRYVNRYGGGLVIYWSGFDERLLSGGGGGSHASSPSSSAAAAASSAGPSSPPPPPPPRAGVAVAATLPSALRGALRTLPRLALPARAAPAAAALAE